MKFIHTSDWHIGRQLHNESLLDEQALMLQQIASLAAEHGVDALVVAGDIYDRAIPPANAVALLNRFLDTLLLELKIPVIMIAGNHDSHERLGFGARQMSGSGLHICGPLERHIKPVRIESDSGAALFYPIPYAEPAMVRQLFEVELSSHQDAMALLLDEVLGQDGDGLPKVVVAHCFLDGGSGSDSERPLSIGGADRIDPMLFSAFDYAALGHLHGPQFKGAPHVRYSGSPLKYSFSEQHQNKSVTLVGLQAGQPAVIELLPLTPRRDVRIIEGYLQQLLEQAPTDPGREDYLMVRLLDTQALLDPMGKLRSHYPNVLHLERTGLMARQASGDVERDRVQKGELEMFSDFFGQVQGEPMSDAQRQLMTELIEALHREESR
ncbi:exonuclease SbcCD subunit D [Shewanella cyperi]|uniref:exonuclease SbcCD subunit D n=1 Tax=Shewanella cyperi TaxID=2814292 RepID=UPI001A94799A|nr:exonuclease SbcCD subunit D [Shewanella cyperi]QSX42054.1 exonuclease SbcCD subunit D [Shewanella cyperi]